jgi:sortase A
VKVLAKVCLGVGLLLLAFVAYQLWGTALYEHSAQARLQQELRPSLRTTGTLPKTVKGTGTSSSDALTSHAAPPTADPPVGQPVGLLSIPAIGISKDVIVEGTGEGQLQEGPGHYQGTPLPGEAGNAAIAGHRTTYGAPFYDLDGLHPGDAIDVETPQGLFQYLVVVTKIVQPSDTSVLQPSVLPELTLTTCNPRYSASQRLVVQALLHTSLTDASFVPTPRSTTGSPPTSLAGGSESGSTSSGSDVAGGVLGAVLWGLGAVAAAFLSRLAFRRLGGAPRWVGLLGGVLAVYLLLGCFQHVSLALPASF